MMTIDGLHYIESVIVSDNPYELTLLCDTHWKGEVFEVPATVVHEGREFMVTGVDVGESSKLEHLRELRIPSTVRHIFPEACVGIKSLRKVNIPDHCRVYSGAFAECGIEELILGENVILEEGCFEGIRATHVNIPDTTKWSPWRREDYESDSCFEFLPVSADSMDDFIEIVFGHSMWHLMREPDMNPTKRILEILNEHHEALSEWGYESPEEITDGLTFDINTCLWHPGWIRVEYDEAEGVYFITAHDREYGCKQEVGFVQKSELFNIMDKLIREGMTDEEIDEIRKRWWSIP